MGFESISNEGCALHTDGHGLCSVDIVKTAHKTAEVKYYLIPLCR